VGKNQFSQLGGSEAGNDWTVIATTDSRMALFVKIQLDSTISDWQFFKGQFFKGMERILARAGAFAHDSKRSRRSPCR
jgi:hypothetical protein